MLNTGAACSQRRAALRRCVEAGTCAALAREPPRGCGGVLELVQPPLHRQLTHERRAQVGAAVEDDPLRHVVVLRDLRLAGARALAQRALQQPRRHHGVVAHRGHALRQAVCLCQVHQHLHSLPRGSLCSRRRACGHADARNTP